MTGRKTDNLSDPKKKINWQKMYPPPENGIAFVGSSTFTLWVNMQKDLEGLPVFNAAFGGSSTQDLLDACEEVAGQYNPKLYVVYSGINDIQSLGIEPATAAKNVRTFVLTKTTVPVIILGLVESPCSRMIHIESEIAETNRLLKEFADEHERVDFVEINSDERFKDPELFLYDNLHLNNTGHVMLAEILRPMIEARFQTDYGSMKEATTATTETTTATTNLLAEDATTH